MAFEVPVVWIVIDLRRVVPAAVTILAASLLLIFTEGKRVVLFWGFVADVVFFLTV